MRGFLGHARVFPAVGPTDARNSLHLDPLSGHLFVFANSRRNRLKILF